MLRRLLRDILERDAVNSPSIFVPAAAAAAPLVATVVLRVKVAIIGAGVAGLVCARILTRGGFSVRLLEASDGVGGRVRTDEVDGFLLDRGFQVNKGLQLAGACACGGRTQVFCTAVVVSPLTTPPFRGIHAAPFQGCEGRCDMHYGHEEHTRFPSFATPAPLSVSDDAGVHRSLPRANAAAQLQEAQLKEVRPWRRGAVRRRLSPRVRPH